MNETKITLTGTATYGGTDPISFGFEADNVKDNHAVIDDGPWKAVRKKARRES